MGYFKGKEIKQFMIFFYLKRFLNQFWDGGKISY